MYSRLRRELDALRHVEKTDGKHYGCSVHGHHNTMAVRAKVKITSNSGMTLPCCNEGGCGSSKEGDCGSSKEGDGGGSRDGGKGAAER